MNEDITALARKYAEYATKADAGDPNLSDAVYFCKGWHESKGCLVEAYIAETNGIRHYHDLRFIPKAE